MKLNVSIFVELWLKDYFSAGDYSEKLFFGSYRQREISHLIVLNTAGRAS